MEKVAGNRGLLANKSSNFLGMVSVNKDFELGFK